MKDLFKQADEDFLAMSENRDKDIVLPLRVLRRINPKKFRDSYSISRQRAKRILEIKKW